MRIAAIALTVLMLGAPLSSRAAEPLVIPVLVSQTGQFAFLGMQEVQTLQLLEKATNAAGGYKGQPVHFDFEDDESNPQVDIQLVNALIAKHVPAILGSNSVAACNVLAPLTRDGPVVYCFSPGAHPEAGSFMFSAGIASSDVFRETLRYFRDRGLHRIATLWTTDASGQDAERGFAATLARPENAAIQAVVNEHFNPADLSVSAQMAHIANSGAQACQCFATGTPYGTILRAYSTAGLTIPLVSSTGNMVYSQMLQYQSMNLDRLYFMGFPYNALAALPRGAVRSAVEAFYNAFRGTDYHPDSAAGDVWDPARILMAALHDLGPGATAAQVRDYVDHLRAFPGIDGMYDFVETPNRGLNGSSAVLTRWDPTKQTWVPVAI